MSLFRYLLGGAVGLVLALSVLATPALADSCPNAQYRTGPSTSLPDCRAYEQVTPPDKDGYNTGLLNSLGLFLFPQLSSSGSGDAIGYGSEYQGPTLSAPGGAAYSAYLSTRGAGGWSTKNLDPPFDDPAGVSLGFPQPLAFSPDLSNYFFDSIYPETVNGSTGANGYEENVGSGAETLMTPDLPDGQLSNSGGAPFAFAGSSTDGSRVVYASNYALTTSTDSTSATNPNDVNVYEDVNGQPVLVSVLPDGSASPFPSVPGSGTGSTNPGTVAGAVSTDGSHVYWTEATSGTSSVGSKGNIYLSDIGAAGQVTSVQVNASSDGTVDPNGFQPAQYWGATPSGSAALITSPQKLTADATTGSSDGGNDLYEYDAATGTLSDLSVDSTSSDANGADVLGVAGYSRDGSVVYFVATGVLASGATAGADNLYVWNDGTTSYITTLGSGDSADWVNYIPAGSIAAEPSSRVDADGSDLVFKSNQTLTSANVSGNELYRYDLASQTLSCVSCSAFDPTPTAGAAYDFRAAGAQFNSTSYKFYVPGNLSADGTRVFFDDPNALVPGADSGTGTGATVDNVYEWEADGAGSCNTSGGCLYLISQPNAGHPSYFLDATSSGNDVFMLTDNQLVSSDTDDETDIYDARVGGGFAGAMSTSCTPGVDCQNASSIAPQPPAAATVMFSGPGNAPSAPPTTSAKRLTGKVMASKRVTKTLGKGSTFVLVVKVPAKGQITVTCARVKRLAKKVGKAGSFKLTIHLSKAATKQLKSQEAKLKRAVKRRGKKAKQAVAQLRVKVAYQPASGKASSVIVTVTVKA